jgi:hypothetical protein
MPSPGVIEFPAALDTALSLIEVANNATSTLTGNISVSDLLIPVADPGKFTNSGIATLTDSLTTPTKIEVFVYTSKSGSNLVVPVGGRGTQGTTAFAFSTGNFVEQRPTARHHTALADAIIALQTKLGIGADGPGATVEALLSNGAGASLWRAIVAGDLPNLPISQITALQAALDGKQPLDADLTAIAALSANGFLRKVGGVWQMSNPVTAFSLAFGIADPSSPTVGVLIGHSWIAPDNTNITLTKAKINYNAGVHNPDTQVELAVQVRFASSGWTTVNNIVAGVLNNINNVGIVVYTTDFGDVPIAPGDTITPFINSRIGAIGERDVSVTLMGTQQVI